MSGKIVGAALVPGLPHLLQSLPSEGGKRLILAMGELEKQIGQLKPDTLLVYSTQWISVLGTSYQTHARLKGEHVDENWHEMGALPFDFQSDVTLSTAMAASASKHGFPVKLIDFEEFPIDTGTIVALSFLNRGLKLPVSAMSCWVYADSEKGTALGASAREAVAASGKRVFAIGITSLSQRYFTHEIDLAEDRVSDTDDDTGNQKLLGLIETGDLKAASLLAKECAAQMPFDMGGAAFHWLRGVCGDKVLAGKVLAYGPLWGTGNAVAQLVVKD